LATVRIDIAGKTHGTWDFYGFGAAAHTSRKWRSSGKTGLRVYKTGDSKQDLPDASGGVGWWFDELPPEQLDAAIIFAPVGALVPAALRALGKGGTVVCGGIHMSDIPSFPYQLLWKNEPCGRRQSHAS